MKKFVQVSFLAFVAIALFISIAFAGTQSYNISVRIPTIPGVNAPAVTQTEIIDAQSIAIHQDEWESFAQSTDINYEEIAKGEKEFLIETITDF